jgi:hypothetical protein
LRRTEMQIYDHSAAELARVLTIAANKKREG